MSSKRKRAAADSAPAIISLKKGTRLRVWWTGENQWFSGEVSKCATGKSNDITLHYDDGEILVHDLSTERWQLLGTGNAPIKQRKKNAPGQKRKKNAPEQKRKTRDKPTRCKKAVAVDQDSDPFVQVRNAFHPSSMEKMTSCREAQVKTINSFFEACVSAHIGGSLYLCGSPGTGKTASMDVIRKSLVAARHVSTAVYINGMEVFDKKKLFQLILEKFGITKAAGLSHSQALERLRREFRGSGGCGPKSKRKKKKLKLLIVDEIESLLCEHQQLLYPLFEWPKLPNSTIIFVGISNAVDLTSRFLPELEKRHYAPKLLIFEPYSEQQIAEIIRDRLKSCRGSPVSLDPGAVELCARKIALENGDARRALNVIRRAIHRACNGAVAGTQITVGVGDVATVLSESFGSKLVPYVQQLPVQAKVLLCVLLSTHQPSVPEKQLHKRYVSFCSSRLKMKRHRTASLSVFSDLLMRLEEGSLIKLTGKRRKRKGQRGNLVVHAEVPLQDVAFAVKDLRECHRLLEQPERKAPSETRGAAVEDDDPGLFPTRTDDAFLPDHHYD